ncbi:MAG TPA: DivIVA domain-containing protein [Thermodesulfobacteriota bacterium]|jgi:cell division initiation protein|nr:DivIVA domain-containing protein [Thermodesulfobacteriota bacterium]
MKITPVDIEQQQFRVKFRGFDMAEVDAFLDVVAEEMDALIRENISLKEEIKKHRETEEDIRSKEKVINDTMVSCQKIAADLKANAEKEAVLVVAQARVEADRIIAEAHQRLAQVRQELLDLRKRKIQFEAALRSMVESHLKMLDLEMQEEDEQ